MLLSLGLLLGALLSREWLQSGDWRMQGDTHRLMMLRSGLSFRALRDGVSHPISQQGRQGPPGGCEAGFVCVQLPVLGGRGQGHGDWGCSKDCTGRFLPRLVQGWVLGSLPLGLTTALQGRTRGAVWAQTRSPVLFSSI